MYYPNTIPPAWEQWYTGYLYNRNHENMTISITVNKALMSQIFGYAKSLLFQKHDIGTKLHQKVPFYIDSSLVPTKPSKSVYKTIYIIQSGP